MPGSFSQILEEFGEEATLKKISRTYNDRGDEIETLALQPISGMISYWNFDEGTGTTAYDALGINNGILINNPVRTTGQVGGALNFDGVDDYVMVPDSPLWNFDSKNFSIIFWGKTSSTSDMHPIIHRHGNPHSHWYIKHHQSSGQGWTFGGFSTWPIEWNTGISTNDGQWHFMAFVRDGSNFIFYLDGMNRATRGNVVTIRYTAGYPLYFGGPGPMGHHVWDGLIDEVAIFNRALTAEEIQQMYNRGLAGQSYGQVSDAMENTIKGIFQYLSDEEKLEKYGGIETIDATFFVETTSIAEVGDKIKYRDQWFFITSALHEHLKNVDEFLELGLKKAVKDI